MNNLFTQSRFKITALAGAVALSAVLAGCGGDDPAPAAVVEAAAVTAEDVAVTSAKIAFQGFSDSLTTAQALKVAIDAFVDTPNTTTLTTAKTAWFASREPYGQTEVYRFDDGIVDDWEGKVNAWPLGESLIDYVAAGTADGDAGGGATTVTGNIISDTSVAINKASIEGLHEADEDEANVATGYHAIEFLLWGQDLNTASAGTWTTPRDNTPGQRPISDYSKTAGSCTSGAGNTVANAICVRRGTYLKEVTNLLIDDLTFMKNQWDPAGTGNRYVSYTSDSATALKTMLSGMGRLSFGELAGERIDIARLDDSQEDEHSCFSDNTHRDIVANAQGIQNTFLGSLNGTSFGPGLFDLLVAQGQQTLADKLKANLETTKAATEVINAKAVGGNPFDNQIQATDKTAISAVITALINQASRDQGGSIADVITALGVSGIDVEGDTDQSL